MRVAAIILAAGAGSRFGGSKLRATVHGRPLVAHVVAKARSAGLDPIVIVQTPDGGLDDLDLGGDLRRVVNSRPDEGLSSSVRLGLRAVELDADVEAAVILLGDQPLVRSDVIERLLAAASQPDSALFVAPRYPGDGAPNPVLALRAGWRLADELVGDRGLGPLLADRPDVVDWIDVAGANPDVDTAQDLVAVLEAAWADRVRANREQVDRVREVPDRDFYAPVSSLFVADPRRTGEKALDELLGMAEPGDRWLDIGAGAGRYSLPPALHVAEVVAVEPSASMRNALRAGKAEHGLENVRIVAGSWPGVLVELGDAPVADVALIAHVGYDIEEIGPFLDGIERAAGRLCVAMLTDRSPASVADPFWPAVHGVERVPLPALPELAELLRARGRGIAMRHVERAPRTFDSFDGLATFLRRQLWITEGGEKDARFRASLASIARERDDNGWALATPPVGSIGVLTWEPPGPTVRLRRDQSAPDAARTPAGSETATD